MRNMLRLSLRLLAITLIAGLALGTTYALTREPIRRQNLAKAEQARRSIFGEAEFVDASGAAEALKQSDAGYAAVTGAYYAMENGETAGCVVTVTAAGYGGGIELTVGIDAAGSIAGLEVGGHNETPGLGARASDEAFTGQFAGKAAPLAAVKSGQAGDGEINAITGATITSRGITDAVNTAAAFAAALMETGGAS